MSVLSARVKRALAATTAGLILSAALPVSPATADLAPPPDDPVTLSGLPGPTWQTNGIVRAIEIVGSVVFVGGNFTSVRPPGAAPGVNETPRLRIAAFDVNTGGLLPFAPALHSATFKPSGTVDIDCTSLNASTAECASVFAIEKSPDGSRIFVGGDFQTVDGLPRPKLAAFSAAGALDTAFTPPAVHGRVNALAISPGAVYFGGNFTSVTAASRINLGAVNAMNGALLPWAPTADKPKSGLLSVTAMEVSDSGSRVVIGGSFDKLNGISSHAIGAVDAVSGALVPWQDNRIAPVSVVTSSFKSGGLVYTTGLDTTGSKYEGVAAYNPETGAVQWFDGCAGASYSAAMLRGVVYVGSHSHDCSAMVNGFGEQYHSYGPEDQRRYTLRAEVPFENRAKLLHWFPTTNDGNGAFDMASDNNNLWLGGEFTVVDGVPQQGLTRFQMPDAGGVSNAPETPSYPFVFSTMPNQVQITWKATDDADHRNLTYYLYKDGVFETPIAQASSSAEPWQKNWMTFFDNNVAAGQLHFYDVRAVDPGGHISPASPQIWVTVAGGVSGPAVIADQEWATAHYGFDRKSGSGFASSVQKRTAKRGSGVSDAAGTSVSGPAVSLAGDGALADAWQIHSVRQSSFELMFSTKSKDGGALSSIGTSANPNELSGSNTSVLYMSDDGRLNFGVSPDTARVDPWVLAVDSKRTLRTPAAYNDGKWHHVIVTFQPGTGTRIYVDGSLASEDPTMNWSKSVYGYYRLGGDRVRGWDNAPSSPWFTGSIDEAAIYEYPLSGSQAARHAMTMLGQYAPMTPPVVRPPTPAEAASGTVIAPVLTGSATAPAIAAKPTHVINGFVSVSLKKGKTRKLPGRTMAGKKVTWKVLTPKRCTIVAGKVVAKKKGICKVKAKVPKTKWLSTLKVTFAIHITK